MSKSRRLSEMIERLKGAEPVSTGLLAYKLISVVLNAVEDEALGADHWSPPRAFGPGGKSERLYPTYPESMHSVEGWPGVTMLKHSKQLIFIGLRGAFQIQARNDACVLPFDQRAELVLLDKPDTYGSSVWTPEPPDTFKGPD